MTVTELLIQARSQGASDVHLSVGLPVTMRLHGKLIPMGMAFPDAETEGLIRSLCTKKQLAVLDTDTDLDFAVQTGDRERYRVNVYRTRIGLAAAVRILNGTIPTLESLGLPTVMQEQSMCHNGLVLITGPTGSGKSTTLAAMIDYVSRVRGGHILTVEDPIEYVFEQNNALIHQREVGETVPSFAAALRSALREDPDVLLVGEMRDYETMATAVTAAETGHLVLSTLHTTGASATIDRIVDTCPSQMQHQMRSQLSMILRGVVTQQLIPLAAGGGRVVATEVLRGTDAVGNLIRENKCFQLPSIMQSGAALGMHTMNGDLIKLVQGRKITRDMALNCTNDRADLLQAIG